jgi:N utilization substance protein A
MDIDLSVLRSLESEKDISLDLAIKAIEDALLVAYHKSEGASPSARVEVDRKSGHVTVWAIQTGPDGAVVQEYDDTPAGFGRIAATTARQVILQRLRDVEDELTFGEYAGREGDIVAGVIQQGKDPRTVLVDLGKLEAVLPPAEQVPGERYVHGERIRCYVLHVRKGHRGPSVTLSRTHPGLVKKLFALEVPEIAEGAVEIVAIAREAGHRTKIAVRSHQQGVNAKGACIGPMGSRVRNVMNELQRAVPGPGQPGARGRPGGARGPGHRARLPAVPGHRQGGPERQAGRPPHRLADRHPLRRRARRIGRTRNARNARDASRSTRSTPSTQSIRSDSRRTRLSRDTRPSGSTGPVDAGPARCRGSADTVSLL